MRHAEDEVRGAVEPVDHPAPRRPGDVGALLAEQAVVGAARPQQPDDRALGGAVGGHHRVPGRGLVGDLAGGALGGRGAGGRAHRLLGQREIVGELVGHLRQHRTLSSPMPHPSRTAVGTWSGGRFMRFGRPLDDERLLALLRPGDGIDTVITADAYGAGEADALLGRALRGRPARGLLPDRRDRPRLLRGRARGGQGLPALHRSPAARPGRVRGLRAHGGRAQPRALRRRALRRPAAAQPGPHGLHEPGGVGRAPGRPRRGPGGAARRRPRPRQRLHARRHRLLRALRRADRLGDDHPQPARAVARRAGAPRGTAPRRAADHPRRRLRRPVPRRRPARARVRPARPPRLPPRRAGSRPAATRSSACARSPTPTA